MSSNYKLEFTLKQHTPMIHFQSDQTGATLRATELKPKLDRFLREEVFGNEYEKYKKFLIAGQDEALDYKVRIFYSGENHIDYPKPFVKRGTEGYVAPYFADGKSIEHKDIDNINLQFYTFNTDLLKVINDNIAFFLTFENFGTRQSKGFGSYHLKETTKDDFEQLIKKHPFPVFKLTTSNRNAKEALKHIDLFYRKLKAGLNPKANRGKHFKSVLFEYMCTKDSGWEKRWIKQKFPEVVYGDHTPVDCTPPKEYHYIRALLGLAELNEYYPYGQDRKLQIKIEGVKRDPEDRKKEKALYQRFKSPITFKVFESSIYLLHNHTYEAILGEEFYFSFKGNREKLPVPEKFDLYDFLHFAEQKIPELQELS